MIKLILRCAAFFLFSLNILAKDYASVDIVYAIDTEKQTCEMFASIAAGDTSREKAAFSVSKQYELCAQFADEMKSFRQLVVTNSNQIHYMPGTGESDNSTYRYLLELSINHETYYLVFFSDSVSYFPNDPKRGDEDIRIKAKNVQKAAWLLSALYIGMENDVVSKNYIGVSKNTLESFKQLFGPNGALLAGAGNGAENTQSSVHHKKLKHTTPAN